MIFAIYSVMDDVFLSAPKTIIANWKMYGDPKSLAHWLGEIAPTSYHVGLCLQSLLIPFALHHPHPFVKIGAQDCHYCDEGAFTGYISPKLLAHMGVNYVLMGHSERRLFETDEEIHKKAVAALRHHLIPIICVGESLEIRERGAHFDFVSSQIKTICTGLSGGYIVAYEPRFAIGTGRIPILSDIEEMHAHIYQCLHACAHKASVPILYGGSVKPENAHLILTTKHVSGLLVGGASLNSAEFNGILAA